MIMNSKRSGRGSYSLKYYFSIFLSVLRKIMTNFSQDILCPSQYSNPEPPNTNQGGYRLLELARWSLWAIRSEDFRVFLSYSRLRECSITKHDHNWAIHHRWLQTLSWIALMMISVSNLMQNLEKRIKFHQHPFVSRVILAPVSILALKSGILAE